MRILKLTKVATFLVGIMMMAILLCCSSQVQAAQAGQAGQDGDYTYFFYTEAADQVSITKYTGTGGDVTIPSTLGGFPVTRISAKAFFDCAGLTNICIPLGVTYIDRQAFSGCTGLTSISISQSIGRQAFSGCTGLTSINISQGVTGIAEQAFENCTGLTNISLPQSVTYIGDYAFSGCIGLTTFTVAADNLEFTSIDGVLFNKAGTILMACPGGSKNISIPQGVTSIGRQAFSGCTGLTSINIPHGVTLIDVGAFENCTGLTSISIPESVTSIWPFAFTNCTSLTSINIPQGVTSIYAGTFKNCTGLTSINIPQGVTDFIDAPCNGCTGLTSITFNSATTTLPDSEYTIPATTKIIGYVPSTAKTYATKYNRTFEVIGTTNTLLSIAITTPATKLNYSIGDNLDIIGLIVTGTYSDGSTKAESITAENVKGFNSAVAATDQVLTITVGTKTTTYKVDILAAQDTTGMTEIVTPSPIAAPNKVWTIKLNGLVNESSLNGKIYVTNSKGKKQQITCTVTTVNGLSQIEVNPDDNYTPGDYMLWVKNITSTKGIGIKKQVFLRFTVQ